MPLGKLAIGNILSNLCIFKPTCLRKMPVGVPFYGALLEICVISTDMSVPKITQQYQVFACMIEMLLDHRLDSSRHVHSSIQDIPIELSFTLQPWCLNVIPWYRWYSIAGPFLTPP